MSGRYAYVGFAVTKGCVMRNGLGLGALSDDYYVLQINGEVKSCHRRYIDALMAAVQLQRQFPLSVIKVRDANELTRFRSDGDGDMHSLRIH
jgi:hypothetical protein